MKDAYAEVNGQRLHYVTEGTGPLLLFLHGFPEFWYAWKAQLAEFGRNYQAVALDMRGTNLSSKPAEIEQYQMQHRVEDIRALAAHLGHEKFTLVGHDWGGAAAWVFAAAYPALVEKLIIINSPHPAIFGRELSANPMQQQASQYMNFLSSPQAEQLLAADNYALLRERFLGHHLWNNIFTEADRQAYLAAWAEPGSLTGGLNLYRVPRASQARAEGQTTPGSPPRERRTWMVNVPTLVIWGEQDTALLTGNLDGLEQFVPHLTIKRIPDASHWVIHEQPALVNTYIREFLTA